MLASHTHASSCPFKVLGQVIITDDQRAKIPKMLQLNQLQLGKIPARSGVFHIDGSWGSPCGMLASHEWSVAKPLDSLKVQDAQVTALALHGDEGLLSHQMMRLGLLRAWLAQKRRCRHLTFC